MVWFAYLIYPDISFHTTFNAATNYQQFLTLSENTLN